MKIRKPILYIYILAIFFSFLYYFLSKTYISPLVEKYPDKPIKIFQMLFYFTFAIIYMWIPGVIALIFAKKEKIKIPIFDKLNKYYLYAIYLPIIFSLLIVFVSMIFAKIDISYIYLMLPSSFIIFKIAFFNYVLYFLFLTLTLTLLGVTFITFLGLGQEIMWRGYLLEKLQNLKFWHKSLLIGTLWGIYHVPNTILFGQNYPHYKFLALVWLIILTILSTPLYIYLRTKGKSVLVSAIFHGIFNAIAPYSVMFFNQPNYLLVGATGLASIIVWLLVDLFLYIMVQKKINSNPTNL